MQDKPEEMQNDKADIAYVARSWIEPAGVLWGWGREQNLKVGFYQGEVPC